MTAVFTSCSSEEPFLTKEQVENTSADPTQYHIDEDDAVCNAINLIQGLNQTPTRSANKLNVKSIQYVKTNNIATRSNDLPDTLLYVINFENNEGFAIMSADKRAFPVYAISDEGNFAYDEKSNPGIDMLMNNITVDVQQRIIGYPISPTDTLISGGFNDLHLYHKYHIGPHLTKYQRELSPTCGISKYCKNRLGQPALTGRAAIALEQFISYMERYRLSEATSDEDHVAHMIEVLGREDYLNLIYKDQNNEALFASNSETLITALTKWGFSVLVDFQSLFNYNKCNQCNDFICHNGDLIHLLNRQPVIVTGSSPQNSNLGVWIIDGYLGCALSIDLGKEPTYVKKLYHCVWGEGGDCNGYYYIDHTKAFTGTPDYYYYDDPTPTDWSSNINYSLNLQYIGVVSYDGWFFGV